MSNNQRRAPPLAGRPPFATDEPDSVYDNVPAARPRQVQKPQQNPGRDSMYQAWDNYLHTDKDKDSRPNSGVGGIGMGLMAGDMDDSDEEDQAPARRVNNQTNAPAKPSNLRPQQQQQQQQQERPNPSYEAPRGQMNNGRQPIARPAPAAAAPPPHRQGPFAGPPQFIRPGVTPPPQNPRLQHPQQPPMAQPIPRPMGVQRPAAAALRVDVPSPAMPIPRAPIPAFMQSPSPSPSPSLNPHPLNAPSTPITPVFARPSFQDPEPKVEFAEGAIMRGNSEETLLPRGTQKGEEFWRRFSYFAKEDPKVSKSSWLKSTVGSSRSMSRWIWCISIFLLLAIGGGIGFGWYMTHADPPTLPLAVGGSANESQISTATLAPTTQAAASGTSRILIPATVVETRRDLGDFAAFDRRTPSPTAAPEIPQSHQMRKRLNRLAIDALD